MRVRCCPDFKKQDSMQNYRAKSNIVLGFVAVIALIAFFVVEQSKSDVKQEWYAEKLKAATLAQEAFDCLKENRLEKGVFIDVVNDPNQTALIGQEYTEITTDRGYIDAKLSSLNPNMAAVVVQFLKDAEVKKNDCVAVAFTGSFPAMNIAVMSAIEVLELNPVIISSVGASNYGANDPLFTWLDMETVLMSKGIFSHKSIAASIGGGFDEGRGLSPEGRDLILDAILRNQVPLIHEGHLEKNIEKRMQVYQQQCNNKAIKAFINVGGGIASLGHTVNADLIPTGLIEEFPDRNFPVRGVIIQMGQKNIPVIQLLNVDKILKRFDLPDSPVPMPKPGKGGVFYKERYNLWITGIATFCLLAIIIFIYRGERKVHRLGSDVVPIAKPSTETQSQEEFDEL